MDDTIRYLSGFVIVNCSAETFKTFLADNVFNAAGIDCCLVFAYADADEPFGDCFMSVQNIFCNLKTAFGEGN